MTNKQADSEGLVPYTAGEVERGWVLRYDGVDRVVEAKRFSPARPDDTERRVRIWFRDGHHASGDEGQTVFRVI